MSYTYLREEAAVSWAESYSEIPPSVLSRLMLTVGRYSSKDKETAACQSSQSGTTSEHSTADRGADSWMSSVEDFLASRTPQPVEDNKKIAISLLSFAELLRKSARRLYFQKTSSPSQCGNLREHYIEPVTIPESRKPLRKTWVLTTFGKDTGYLHTPTTKNNLNSPCMVRKWKSCRLFGAVFGKVTPTNQEWMMGWPIGWTGLERVETDKFRQWLSSHGRR